MILREKCSPHQPSSRVKRSCSGGMGAYGTTACELTVLKSKVPFPREYLICDCIRVKATIQTSTTAVCFEIPMFRYDIGV